MRCHGVQHVSKQGLFVAKVVDQHAVAGACKCREAAKTRLTQALISEGMRESVDDRGAFFF